MSLGVEVERLECVALKSDVGIALNDIPVEVPAYIASGDVVQCIRVAEVDCLSDDDIGLTCLDVDIGYVDCIHLPDVNCGSDVEVALFFLS